MLRQSPSYAVVLAYALADALISVKVAALFGCGMRKSRQHEPDPVPGVEVQDVRIGLAHDPVVSHSGQPDDYVHTDGTAWTWRERWRIVAGTLLRMYDLIET